MEALGGRIENIGKILEVIEDIADQTNLLSPKTPPSMRPAQANTDWGFAVVAEEIRKLAEESIEATSKINDLVQAIQVCSAQAVQKMAVSSATVSRSIEMSTNLDDGLARINAAVKKLAEHVSIIAVSTQEQAARRSDCKLGGSTERNDRRNHL